MQISNEDAYDNIAKEQQFKQQGFSIDEQIICLAQIIADQLVEIILGDEKKDEASM